MNLLITGAWRCTEEQLDAIKALGHQIVFMQNESDALPVDPQWVEGMVCNGLFLHHEIGLFSNLRFIQLTSAGYDRVPMEEVNRRGIRICNARGVYGIPMAEFAVSGVLRLYKNSRAMDAHQQQHAWIKERQLLELWGKQVTIVGCGNIGQECAKRFAAFDSKVIGVDIFEAELPHIEKMCHISRLKEVLPQSDVVVLTLPLTEQTKNLFCEETFAVMKPGAVLLNFSRNELVDNEAVKAALASGQLKAYVVDFPSDDLLGVEKVIAIPHLGASTEESEENCASMAAAQLRDYLEVGSIHNSVNLPEVALGAPEGARILVIHENVPNTIAPITACISAEGVNINNLTNKSKKDMAVTVVDVPELPSDQAIANIKRLPGVFRVRTFG